MIVYLPGKVKTLRMGERRAGESTLTGCGLCAYNNNKGTVCVKTHKIERNHRESLHTDNRFEEVLL